MAAKKKPSLKSKKKASAKKVVEKKASTTKPAKKVIVKKASAPKPAKKVVVKKASTTKPAKKVIVKKAAATKPAKKVIVKKAAATKPAKKVIVKKAAATKSAKKVVVKKASTTKSAKKASAKKQNSRDKEKARLARKKELATRKKESDRKAKEKELLATKRMQVQAKKREQAERAAQKRAKSEAKEQARESRQAAQRQAIEERDASKKREQAERAAQKRAKSEAKEQARTQKQEARVAAKLQAEAEASAKKLYAQRLRDFKQLLDGIDFRQVERWGAKLPLLVYNSIRTLVQRPDVKLLKNERFPAETEEALLPYWGRVSPVLLAFYREAGGLLFVGRACSESAKGATHDEAYGVHIPPLGELAASEVSCFRNQIVAPARLGSQPASSTAVEEGENCELLEYYLTHLAEQGFAQNQRKRASRGQLLQDSLPYYTDHSALSVCLEEKGLPSKDAKSMLSWLGSTTRIFLHLSETKEGARRFKILKSLPRKRTSCRRGIDRKLIAEMNQGEPLDKKQWMEIRKQHELFLSRGGGGGEWELTVLHGMPRATYMGKNSLGQACLSLQNLGALKFSNALLEFSDLSGVRAEGANFSKARLAGSLMSDSFFKGARFSAADLSTCNFTGSDLAGADFRNADLSFTDFESANLKGANFKGATTTGTKFGGADLENIKY